MNFDIHAPWEHYPKNLSQQEISNPSQVITDIFSAGCVKSHKRKLKEWRSYVTSDTHYNDETHGPGDLLFTYELNLKLLEAIYLLWINHQNVSWNFKEVSDEQIANEKDSWDHYPKNLKLREQANPYRAIKKVFSKISPQQYREYLHEWLYFALYNTPADEDLTTGEILSVYENLLKLYSAAWLIHQRESNSVVLNAKPYEVESYSLPNVQIKPIAPQPTAAEALGLEEIRKLIIERFPAVRLIIHLGTHQDPYTFYLLILVDDDYKTPEHAISNKIEDNCRYLANVLTPVHKVSSAKTALKYGSRFWRSLLTAGNIIYQSDGLHISANENVEEDFKDSPLYNWERWGVQGKQFLAGAAFYQADHNYRLAAFLLHQAVESILKAVIQSVLGYKISTHNIGRMLKITLLFTEALNDVFELGTTEGSKSFDLLQVAYAEARYRDEFNPDEEAVKQAMVRVRLLYRVAEQVYKLVDPD